MKADKTLLRKAGKFLHGSTRLHVKETSTVHNQGREKNRSHTQI